MKKLSIVFVAALSLAAFGCKKKAGADCEKAINNSMELSKADMAKTPGIDDKMLGKLRDLGIQHCKDDKWSDDTVKCMSDAKTQADAQGCYGKMTAEQQGKMNKAMMEMMTPPGGADMGGASGSAGAGGSAAADGSAAGSATGSDTGAAGSAGSAGSADAPK